MRNFKFNSNITRTSADMACNCLSNFYASLESTLTISAAVTIYSQLISFSTSYRAFCIFCVMALYVLLKHEQPIFKT